MDHYLFRSLPDCICAAIYIRVILHVFIISDGVLCMLYLIDCIFLRRFLYPLNSLIYTLYQEPTYETNL